MKRKELFGITDTIETIVRDKNGNIKSRRIINNSLWDRILIKLGLKHRCITKYGMAEVAGLILTDIGGTAFDYIAIGTGTTAATVDDQTLETEIKRKAATGTRITTTQTNDTSQWVATFSSDDGLSGTSNVTEVGILNAASAGTLLLRQVYSPADVCNWDQGDSLAVTVKNQIKQGS